MADRLRRGLVVAVGGAILLALSVAVVFVARSSVPRKTLEVTVSETNWIAGHVLKVSLFLSNRSSEPFAVASETLGRPALTLEEPGKTRWLLRPVEGSFLTIGPSATLSTAALVTNPPVRFRLNFSIRNPKIEDCMRSMRNLLPKAVRSVFTEWTRSAWNPTNPASPWIE